MADFKKTLKGMKILEKYTETNSPEITSYEDDGTLTFPIEVSKEDAEKLTNIGWFYDDGISCWIIN